MKRLALFVTMTVLGISNCLADDKNKDVPPGLLDPSSTCGINTDVLEECVKKREQGEGTNICNDLKLYAGSLDKLLEVSKQMANAKPGDQQYELLKITREKLLETLKKYKKEGAVPDNT